MKYDLYLSVVVTALNEENNIANCVETLSDFGPVSEHVCTKGRVWMLHGILHGFAHTHPTCPVCGIASGKFANAVGLDMARSDDVAVTIDHQPRKRIDHANRPKVIGLVQQRVRFDEHEAGENGFDTRHKGPT